METLWKKIKWWLRALSPVPISFAKIQHCLTLYQNTKLSKLKTHAVNKLKLGSNVQFCLIDWNTLLEREKMLVTSIFSFSQYFKRPLSQDHEKFAFCGIK